MAKLNEFSAHADRDELLTWVKGFKNKPGRVFVVHGEDDQAMPFAEALRTEAGIPQAVVPALNQKEALW